MRAHGPVARALVARSVGWTGGSRWSITLGDEKRRHIYIVNALTL
jgi:hypothetical protein